VIGAAAAALALSVVPGLAHALRHEFRAIRLYVLSWFGSLALGVIYFGRGFGSASMAAAFVLHAWIAMDAVVGSKPFKERMSALRRLYWRLAGLALGVLLLYAAYVEVRRAVGFTIGLADIAVPADRVELGDVILCRYLGANPEPALRRGDLVLVRASQLVYGDGAHGAHSGYLGETVGQLIALPGDQLRLTREGFVVNGRALDPLEFPVPESLRGDSGPMALGKDEYFVTMEWRVESREVGLAARVAVALRGCVYHRPELLARGVMRWFPLRRRGFLKELE